MSDNRDHYLDALAEQEADLFMEQYYEQKWNEWNEWNEWNATVHGREVYVPSNLLTPNSEDDLLTQDDLLTEDDLLSEDDLLTEDEFEEHNTEVEDTFASLHIPQDDTEKEIKEEKASTDVVMTKSEDFGQSNY